MLGSVMVYCVGINNNIWRVAFSNIDSQYPRKPPKKGQFFGGFVAILAVDVGTDDGRTFKSQISPPNTAIASLDRTSLMLLM